MTPDEAVLIACDRCVTASSLLAAAQLAVDADDRAIGSVLAAGVVSGWADHVSSGCADAGGITVRDRTGAAPIRVRWAQVAAALRPGLHEPGAAEHLAETYARYVAAATDSSVSARLAARVASAELAQARRLILDRCRDGVPVQQSLFPLPPNRGRSLA